MINVSKLIDNVLNIVSKLSANIFKRHIFQKYRLGSSENFLA